MGAWGYGPYDNDQFMDTMYEMTKLCLPDFIERCLFSEHIEDIRGGAAVFVDSYKLLQHVEAIEEEWFEDIKVGYAGKLSSILLSEWPEDWDDVKLIRDNLQIEINGIKNCG